MKKYLAEFAGTFTLVFLGTGSIMLNDVCNGQIGNAGIAIVFGATVMLMIFAFGKISGAHLNPAVTLACWGSGKFSHSLLLPYITSQLLGAFAASGILFLLYPGHASLGATLPSGSTTETLLLEILLTCALVFVILLVIYAKINAVTAGVIIGAVVWLEALFAGPVTGASMNPARSLAPAVVSGQLQYIWIYISAPVIGAIFGILVCYFTKGNACCHLPREQKQNCC